MEAINSMASAAAKAVWGESNTKENENPATSTTTSTTTMNNETHGQEPVSGKQGDVSKGEPYDAGNMGAQFPSLFFLSFLPVYQLHQERRI